MDTGLKGLNPREIIQLEELNSSEITQLEMANNLADLINEDHIDEDGERMSAMDLLDLLGVCGLSLAINDLASITYLNILSQKTDSE